MTKRFGLVSVRGLALGVLAAGVALGSTASQALEIQFNVAIDLISLAPEPEGLAIDPGAGPGGIDILYVSREIPQGFNDITVIQKVGSDGSDLGSFTVNFEAMRGLDLLPNGNLLASLAKDQRVVEISAVDGSVIAGGIDISLPSVGGFPPENESAFFHVANNTVFFGDEEGVNENGRIIEIGLDGSVLNNFPTPGDPFDDPSGMDLFGNLIMFSDDSSGGNRSRIFLMDPTTGAIVDQTEDMQGLTLNIAGCDEMRDGDGCNDPEGIAVNGQEFWVVFEDQSMLLGFTVVPEPSTWVLMSLGTLGLAAARRRSRSL